MGGAAIDSSCSCRRFWRQRGLGMCVLPLATAAATTRISGRRDSNPGPVAAATALPQETREFVTTTPAFVIALFSHRFRTSRETFAANQNPRGTVSRGFRVTRIVTMNSLIDVLTGAYITPACPRALEDINVEHSGPLSGGMSSRAGGIRTRDLLNPIQAHYQAVLRPDLEAHY